MSIRRISPHRRKRNTHARLCGSSSERLRVGFCLATLQCPLYWAPSKALPGSEGAWAAPLLCSDTRSPRQPHVLVRVSPARIMLVVCDLLAISLSVCDRKQRSKPTMCPVFINVSLQPSQGIFIVCNTDRDPIISVQIKVVLNRNLFCFMNILRGPLTSNLRSTA